MSLPSVTPAVTTSDLAFGMGSTGICYPVTNTTLQVGDRVVLMGGGSSRPPQELASIWVVEAIHAQQGAGLADPYDVVINLPAKPARIGDRHPHQGRFEQDFWSCR